MIAATAAPGSAPAPPRRSSERRRRTRKITVRLLPGEWFALDVGAHARGLGVADYVRLVALGAFPLHAAAPSFADLGVPSLDEWVRLRRVRDGGDDPGETTPAAQGADRCRWCDRRGLFVERCDARATREVLGERVCVQHDMRARRLVAGWYDARAARVGQGEDVRST